ncbi:hypothetical protein [Klebsiella huaxiensis]|uniref:hypothetical protein n=1 Tax=Klebsiella huaxiensis TaxID=2153354 RepID=UPI002F35842E
MSEMKIAGIDLAKANFYFFSIDAYGKPAGEIKLSRNNLLNWLVQQHAMTVAMEACGAAREIQKLGHTAILLPAQHVRACRRRQKNVFRECSG